MFGKADPYVRATLGNQVVRSQTINNNQVNQPSLSTENVSFQLFRTLSGIGNQVLRLTPLLRGTFSSRWESNQNFHWKTIFLQVFDDDLGKDDLLGRTILDTRLIVRERWPVNICQQFEFFFVANFVFSWHHPRQTKSDLSISVKNMTNTRQTF